MSRFGYVMATYFMVLAMGIFSLFHHRPRVMWNASASTPVGLYTLRRPGELKVGDLVVDQPPLALACFMAGRHYLPLNVPLLKYVGAITGQTVPSRPYRNHRWADCRNGSGDRSCQSSAASLARLPYPQRRGNLPSKSVGNGIF
jgi:hypothetical protein